MTTLPHSAPARSLPRGRPSPAVAWVACATILAVTAAVRLAWLGNTFLPIAYGMPLVLNLWLRHRPALWAMTAGFLAIAAVKNVVLLPPAMLDAPHRWEALALIAFDTLVIAAVVDAFLAARLAADRRNAELRAANEELAAREEVVARQNEELLSQAGELERQREALRAGTNEVARRERIMQGLLSLSRALTSDFSRQEVFERVCDAVAELLDDPEFGMAVLELEGDELIVRCGRGIANASADVGRPSSLVVPAKRSFARIVLERGRTAYIEDVSLRPDLTLPPAAGGGAYRSVLATPLRVGGRAVGTIEILGRRPGAFSEARIALIESVAAQTSLSLEASELFSRVAAERNRFQAVFRFLPVGVTVIDAATGNTQTNPAGAVIFGLSSDEDVLAKARADGWKTYFEGHALEPSQWPIQRALADGRETPPTEYEVGTGPGGGRRLTLLVGAAPFKDPGGKVVGAVAAYADVSPLKQLQRELDARRREAEEASVRKTRFLAAVSHDIRTPANAICLLAELVRRAAHNPAMAGEMPELANELQGSANALVNLLGDVLDLARFDSGRIELLESEFALADLLEEQRRRLQPLARDRGLELRVALPDGQRLPVRCDRIKLARVIDNLVGNAVKFTPEGFVTVEAERDDAGATRLRVVDTGIGISKDDQRHIFDEFFQLSNPERDRIKGTGLGLTICKRLADAMGGALSVESEVGKGSTFTLTLPPSASA
jgi:PAS domain S-box-containing protein